VTQKLVFPRNKKSIKIKMKAQLLFVLICLSVLLGPTNQGCKISNNCVGTGPDCVPYEVTDPKEKIPYDADPTIGEACPDFVGKKVCCNNFVIGSMLSKWNLLDEAMGSPGTGCSICATNLKRFYCQFNCDPNQDQWMTKTKMIRYSGMDFDILSVDAALTYEDTCNIFKTCGSINFISALGASASPQGFFNLMSSQGVPQGNIFMNWTYQTPSTTPQVQTYNTTSYSCNEDFTKLCKDDKCLDPSGYPLYKQPWCGCGACSTNCTQPDFSQYLQPRTLTSGFQGWIVLIAFGTVILLVVLSAVWSEIRKRHKAQQRKLMRKMSDDDSLADISYYIKHEGRANSDPAHSENTSVNGGPVDRGRIH
jgi:hypothetical protein